MESLLQTLGPEHWLARPLQSAHKGKVRNVLAQCHHNSDRGTNKSRELSALLGAMPHSWVRCCALQLASPQKPSLGHQRQTGLSLSVSVCLSLSQSVSLCLSLSLSVPSVPSVSSVCAFCLNVAVCVAVCVVSLLAHLTNSTLKNNSKNMHLPHASNPHASNPQHKVTDSRRYQQTSD